VNLLQTYFWWQTFWPLIISLTALSLLALLTQSLSTLDLIVDNRQSALTFLYITTLALPQLIAIILPLAVFISSLYTLNRLNTDNELTVAKAVSFSPWQISSPFVRLGVFALIAHLVINLFIQPLAFREMRTEILSIRTDVASQMVRPGEFVTPVPKLTVYAREILPNGNMKDVLIRDSREVDNPLTYTAKSGVLSRLDTQARLTLQDGIIQQFEDDGSLRPIIFESYQIDLSELNILDQVLRLKSSDRFLHELLRPDPMSFVDAKVVREFAAEGHARLATPLYNVALILLVLAFLARGEYQRTGYGWRIAVCGFLGFMARLFGFALTSMSESDPVFNYVQYAFPALIVLFCLWYLTNRNRVKNILVTTRPAPHVPLNRPLVPM